MDDTTAARTTPLAALADARTVVLTTYRRDGTGVPTAMSMAFDGDRADTAHLLSASGKAKRLRRSPRATVAPSTTRGVPTGPAVGVRARFHRRPRCRGRAGRLIAAKHPVLHGVAVPIAHRLTRRTPIYLEVVAAVDDLS